MRSHGITPMTRPVMTDPAAVRTGPPGRTSIGGRQSVGVVAGPGSGSDSRGGAEQTPDETRFINRELSWLEFGARLLQLSADERTPLFERVKFLCLFSEGLDEFFQVRVASLEDQVAAGLRTRSPDGMSPGDQLVAVRARAVALVEWQSRIFRDQLAPDLAAAGLRLVAWSSLDPEDRAQLAEVFERHIFPVLTPLAVDQAHPFPYISDLSLNLVVRVANPATGEERIARVKVPPLLPRFVVLPDGGRFVPVEQLIAAHLDSIFPDMTIAEHHAFRVTRNADVSVDEDEAGDLLAAVELELRRRRFGQAVRLEVEAGLPPDLLAMLISEVDVPEGNVFVTEVPIDLGGLRSLVELDRLEPAHPGNTPVTAPRLATGRDLFAVLSEHDVLVHHPYESFATSVEAFVAAAADDLDVVAIKQTLYRTGDESPVVASLIRASQAGKQVTAVVELQARFDEQANIGWARALEEAGVQVIYGLVSLKTHAKISLVLRREGDELRRYSHIGTGNYNSRTARAYEDVGLLTASPDIGADLGELFNLLTGSGDLPRFRRLLISPVSARSSLVEAVDEEAGAGSTGRIVLKTNALTDPAVIDALYRASQAGTSVDLIVRERCCLRPGVPGLSDRIRVRSIVGRYLEHSRLFRFGGVAGRPLRVWIGSADLMERNLDRRVEVIVPIEDPDLRHRVVRMLDDALRDEANSWTLGPDAAWTRLAGPGPLGFSLQDHLEAQALESLRHRHSGSLSAPAALRAAPGPVPPPEPSPPVASVPWWRRVRRRDI
jgi:polyphosphate kinase